MTHDSIDAVQAVWSPSELRHWMSSTTGEEPGPPAYYDLAVALYELGLFAKAALVLSAYVELPGHTGDGYHLLGYAQYNAGDLEGAVASLRRAVIRGYDDDWQVLVQATLELEVELKRYDVTT